MTMLGSDMEKIVPRCISLMPPHSVQHHLGAAKEEPKKSRSKFLPNSEDKEWRRTISLPEEANMRVRWLLGVEPKGHGVDIVRIASRDWKLSTRPRAKKISQLVFLQIQMEAKYSVQFPKSSQLNAFYSLIAIYGPSNIHRIDVASEQPREIELMTLDLSCQVQSI